MTAGQIMAGSIVAAAVLAGGGMYYLQVYHFYEDVSAATAIRLTPAGGGAPEAIAAQDLQAIDAASSPIRFRACFTAPAGDDALAATYAPHPDPEPLTAPGWFDCFKAAEIGAALAEGRARAFLGEGDITYGIDRVVAVAEDGRGFAWHQINACGEVVFDGDPPPPGCAPPPANE